MKIKEITDAIERFAPLALQEEYDNAGLVVGDPEREVGRALLAVDVTVEKDVTLSGPYARYAQKFFGVRAPLTDKTVWSVTGAQIALLRGLHCYNTTYANRWTSFENALTDAALRIGAGWESVPTLKERNIDLLIGGGGGGTRPPKKRRAAQHSRQCDAGPARRHG